MRLLALCPRIRKHDGCIVATTAWRMSMASFGTMYRKVVINPQSREVSVSSRYIWLVSRSREIPFSAIRAVTYGYEGMSMDAAFSFAHDSFDWFTVGLRLTDDSEFRLFNFIGDGTFGNAGPFPDWLYWDEFAFDFSGSQDKESRVFVDLLSKMIGVKVVPPRLY